MIIDEQEAKKLIAKHSGKFIAVEFSKQDGSKRIMNCRTGVKKYLKQTTVQRVRPPYLVSVYDVRIKQYRSFDIRRLHKIVVGGNTYTVVQSTNV